LLQQLYGNSGVTVLTPDTVATREFAAAWGLNLEGNVCNAGGRSNCYEESMWGMTYSSRRIRDLWQRLQPLTRRLLPVTNPAQALGAGLLWGWLPCGLVYAALAWSLAAGGAAHGALLMASFGLGTLAVVAGIGFLAGRMEIRTVPVRWRQLGGALLVVAGIVMSTGLAPHGGSQHAGHQMGAR